MRNFILSVNYSLTHYHSAPPAQKSKPKLRETAGVFQATWIIHSTKYRYSEITVPGIAVICAVRRGCVEALRT